MIKIYENEYQRVDGKTFHILIFNEDGVTKVQICQVVDGVPQTGNILDNYTTNIDSDNLGALINEAESAARSILKPLP